MEAGSPAYALKHNFLELPNPIPLMPQPEAREPAQEMCLDDFLDKLLI